MSRLAGPSQVGCQSTRQRALLCLAAVLLCSCRAPLPSPARPARPAVGTPPVAAATPRPAAMPSPQVQLVQHVQLVPVGGAAALPTLPMQAFTGVPGSVDPSCWPSYGMPTIPDPARQWSPPGISGPWPSDEYLFDGGDQPARVQVSRDWSLHGLDLEDTVAHFDTLDGRTEVTESNRVPIYAPRFAAVRKIYGAGFHEQSTGSDNVDARLAAVGQETRQVATTVLQPLQAGHQFSASTPETFRDQTRGLNLDNAQVIRGLINDFLPYEDFLVIRRGQYENSEKARLAARMQAATVWSHDLGVQVVIDEVMASEASGAFLLGEARHYELPPGKPRLRIVKVASSEHALPGDIIDFTIRFDNVGDQLIGNVTIVDNLTSRLEYVADSAQCSVDAGFFTRENEGESLVLRWEITDPLKVGSGGIIRFKCRVR